LNGRCVMDSIDLQKMYSSGKISTEKMYLSKNPLENYMQMSRHIVVKTILEKYSAKCKNIIDIGCGVGVYIGYLKKERDLNVIGVDLNRFDLKKAARNNRWAEYVQASAEYLPFKDDSFDLVLFSEVLEHLPNPDYSLKEIHRILRDKGILIISTPSKKGIYENKEFVYFTLFLKRLLQLFRKGSFKVQYKEHISLQTVDELKMKLRNCGFEIIEEFYTGFCFPFAGEILQLLLKYDIVKRAYEKVDRLANRSKLLRDYNWSMIFVCKKREGKMTVENSCGGIG